MANVSYSSKSTAIRGARRAGLVDGTYSVMGEADGRFTIHTHGTEKAYLESIATDIPDADDDGLQAAEIARAKAQVEAEVPAAKLPTYKQTANHNHSSIMKPIEVIRAFLDANPDMSRKAAVIALQAQGINFSTARTQYQKWFKARQGA